MTINQLIEILQNLPDKEVEIFVWDPFGEISGEIRPTVKDIHEPSDGKEVYLIVDFG